MSFPEIQGVEEVSVGLFVVALKVFQQAAPAAYQLKQPLTGVEILLMRLEVGGKLVDSIGQKSDLNLRGAGVGLMLAKLLDIGGSPRGFLNHVFLLSFLPFEWTLVYAPKQYASRNSSLFLPKNAKRPSAAESL